MIKVCYSIDKKQIVAIKKIGKEKVNDIFYFSFEEMIQGLPDLMEVYNIDNYYLVKVI